MIHQQEREMLCRYCRLAYERRLVFAADGNMSLRLSDGSYLITPSHVNKGQISAADMLHLSPEGSLLSGSGSVSSEVKLHLHVYRSRGDVNAVFHTHPIYASVLAATKERFPDPCFIEHPLLLGPVAMADFALPGTEALADSIKPHVAGCDAILLKNHGALVYGRDVEEAFNKLEMLEEISQCAVLAELLGGARPIDSKSVEAMQARWLANRA